MTHPTLRTSLLALILSLASTVLTANTFLDPSTAFRSSASINTEANGTETVHIDIKIAPGYYLYRDKFRFQLSNTQATLGPPQLPPSIKKHDDTFGNTEVYTEDLRILIPLLRDPNNPSNTTPVLKLTSQGCATGGVCYPAQTQTITLTETSFSETPAATDSTGISQWLKHARIWLILLSFFGFGLLLAFTPCVLPMLPILSSIIINSTPSHPPLHRRRTLSLTLAYILGMAVTYTSAGIIAGLTGTLLSTTLQNPWVLGSFALLFVILAGAMFDLYELQLPSRLQTRLAHSSEHLSPLTHRPHGSIPGLILMGALSALIVGPCVAAPLAGALLYISQSRDALLGGAALFSMALGMGAPLLLIGLSTHTLLPKAGAWMKNIKSLFGLILLGTALWTLRPLLSIPLQTLAWATLLIIPAINLHALDPLPPYSHRIQRLGKGIGVILLISGTTLLVHTINTFSLYSPPPPTNILSAPPANTAAPNLALPPLTFKRINTLAELQQHLQNSSKATLLDFYADWCITCLEMERTTFTHPQVQAQLLPLQRLQIDLTQNSPEQQALLKHFGLFGPPALLFFDPQGQEISSLRSIGFQDAQTLLKTLAPHSARLQAIPKP